MHIMSGAGSWLGHYSTPLYSSPGLCTSLFQCSNSGRRRARLNVYVLFRALSWLSHWPKEVTEPSPNSKGAGINFIACRQKQQSHTAKSHAYNDGWYYRSRQPTTTFFSIHTCFFSCRFCLREWCQCPIHSSQSHSSLLLPHLQILQVRRLNLPNAATF